MFFEIHTTTSSKKNGVLQVEDVEGGLCPVMGQKRLEKKKHTSRLT